MLCLHMALAETKQAESPKHGFHWDSHAWQELRWKDSLDRARITERDRKAIAAAIQEELRPNMKDLNIDSEEKLREVALKTRVKMIDLSGDGIPEVVAQAIPDCSPTGNCSVWIFRKAQANTGSSSEATDKRLLFSIR
jgi:hypothetical protein